MLLLVTTIRFSNSLCLSAWAPSRLGPRLLLVDPLEHALRLARREVLQVVVVRRELDEPLAAHVAHLAGEQLGV